MSETEVEDNELASFWRGLMDGGELGKMYYHNYIRFCKYYFVGILPKDHFSDMGGIDFDTIIGGNFAKHFEATDLKGKTGLISVTTGRNPKRYMATIYVPLDVWAFHDFDNPIYRDFLADAYWDAFEEILAKASKVKGRLLQPENTRAIFQKFIADLKAQPLQSHDPDIALIERRRSIRNSLLPADTLERLKL
jgi:hypothetical protein